MNPALALASRELIRWARQPSRIAGTIGTPLLLWGLLAAGFSDAIAAPLDYTAYLLPGMISLVVLFSAIFSAMSLIEDRNEGFLQAVLASPAPRWAIVAGKTLGGAASAWIQASILLLLAPLIGHPPTAAGFAAALLAVALQAFALTGLCLAAAWWVNSTAGFHGIMSALLMPLWILSGAFFPAQHAAGWLRTLVLLNPLAWPLDSIRNALSPEYPAHPWQWGATILWALASCAAASAVMARSTR